MTAELREIRREIAQQEPAAARVRELLNKYPENPNILLLHACALSSDGQDEHAREFVRDQLENETLSEEQRRTWLHTQALIELNAAEPQYFTLDSALQNAFRMTPNAPDLLATKGASFVARGRSEDGGNLLAEAWRQSEGRGDDASMLAYLTIAAHHCGNAAASEHFGQAFNQVNRSVALRRRVDRIRTE